ncbi:restriction endonuclease subunit S [Acinetobacter guillouiae]|uniref:restriction endonuclease subunit S n=1 Tax=Acinetobacter guillouiae TaxID=106649 RepID=UPI003342D9D2
MTGRYKAYPEYKSSGVEWFENIPSHWQSAQLSKLFEIKAGGDLKTEYFSPVFSESYPYPIYTNATDENAVYGYTSKAFYCGNSITVSGRGDVGYAIYREQPFDAIIRLLVLTPRNKIHSKFFMYFIREVINFRVESSAIGQLSTNQISPFKVVFPHFDEQQKIANFLDHETAKIDTLIAKQEKLIELLKEKRQAVISHAVTKGLNPDAPMKDSGVEWLGVVPEHWDVFFIKHLSQVKRGASPRPIDDPKYFDDNGEYAWTRIADVSSSGMYLTQTTQRLSALGSLLSVRLEAGELFLSIAGTVGKPCITVSKACIHDGFVYFPQLKINNKFLYYIFDAGQAYLGLGKMGTQLNLNTDTVGGIKIGLPPDDEIEGIVQFIEQKNTQYSELIDKAINFINLMRERKKTLISAVVTGKIDVRDWSQL